ncbi:unnamed protein product [Heligmosomoides polygyrus]|uniref:MFS domain-containing protein n=1 Tax=Heligmosomoides polygyrus TaxID=6339 RepID=A0A183FWB2_HELPZ|nr:unnamed protein product [Heligmosomoides polygyrus]
MPLWSRISPFSHTSERNRSILEALRSDLRISDKTTIGTNIYFISYLIAYNSISVTWEPCYLGAAELMPTEVRAKSTAALNIVSRVSNIFAVALMKTRWEPGILITVLGSNIFSFIVAFLLLKVLFQICERLLANAYWIIRIYS